MSKMKTLLSVIILLSFISCNYVFSYKGSGNIIKEDRDINTNFSGVIVSNHGDLFIEIGDQVKLTIKGIKYYLTVKKGQLNSLKAISHGDLYYRGKPDLTTDIGKHGTLKSID